MEMGREFSRRSRRAIAGAADKTDQLPGFDDRSRLNPAGKTIEVGEIMVCIVFIPDSNPPPSEFVPSHYFHDPIAGGVDVDTISGKNIRTFVNAPAPHPLLCPQVSR